MTKPRQLALGVSLCATIFATPSLAGHDRPGHALEFSLGRAEQTNTVDGSQPLSGYDTSRAVRGVFAANRVLDLEIGVADFGTATDSGLDRFGDLITDTLETRAATLGIKARLPVGRHASLIARAGLALWELEYQQTDSAFPGDAYRDSDQGTDAYVGIGLQLDLDSSWRVGVHYDTLDLRPELGAATTEHRIDNLSVAFGLVF